MSNRLSRWLVGLYFLLPALGFIKLWPLPSAFVSGLSLIVGTAIFAVSLMRASTAGFRVPVFSAILISLFVFYLIYQLNPGSALGSADVWQLVALLIASVWVIDRETPDGHSIFCSQKITRYLAAGGLFYCLISLVMHYAQFFGPEPERVLARLPGVWGQPNLTSTMAWLAIFSLSFSRFARDHSSLYWSGLVLASVVVGLAASRTSLIDFLLLVILVVWSLKQGTKRANSVKHSLKVLLVILVFAVAAPTLNERLYTGLGYELPDDSFSASIAGRMSADSVRFEEHRRLLRHWLDLETTEQVLGVGNYGAFSLEARRAGFSSALASSAPAHSHNMFSMILVEHGLIALAIALVGTFWVFRRFYLARNEAWFPAIFGCFMVIFIHSQLEYPLWYPWFLMLFVALIGTVDRRIAVRIESPVLMRACSVAVLLVVCLTSLNMVNQLKSILGVGLSEERSVENYDQLRILGRDLFLGDYARLARIRAYGPAYGDLNRQLREIEGLKMREPRDLVLMREVVLLIMSEATLPEICKRAEDLALFYPFTSVILMEKATLLGPKGLRVMGVLPNCLEEGLKPWGEDLNSVAEHNRRIINDAL